MLSIYYFRCSAYYFTCGGQPLQGWTTFFVCFQIFRAPPGKTLSVHFLTIAGSGFELNVTDEGAGNKTLLGSISAVYNGKTVKTRSSSVLEMGFNSEANARDPANVRMVIIIDQGEYFCQIIIIVILEIFLTINFSETLIWTKVLCIIKKRVVWPLLKNLPSRF